MADAGADDIPTMLQQEFGIFDQPRAHPCAGCGKTGHEVSLLSAQELVNGHIKRLCHNIMERNINGGDGSSQYSPTFKILAAIHLLPKCPNLQRIATNQKLTKMANCTCYRQFAVGKSGLAPAIDS